MMVIVGYILLYASESLSFKINFVQNSLNIIVICSKRCSTSKILPCEFVQSCIAVL